MRVRLPVMKLGVDIAETLSEQCSPEPRCSPRAVGARARPAHQLLARSCSAFRVRRMLLVFACVQLGNGIVAAGGTHLARRSKPPRVQFAIRPYRKSFAGVAGLDIVGAPGGTSPTASVSRRVEDRPRHGVH